MLENVMDNGDALPGGKSSPRRRFQKRCMLEVLSVCLIIAIITIALVFAITHQKRLFTSISGPKIGSNFADPCFIEVDGKYYAFATNKFVKPHSSQANVQVATSDNFKKWNLTGIDALPDAGAWATGDAIWGPDVVQLNDGTFVMYYSAQHILSIQQHCVGGATSNVIEGPYLPLSTPLACPLSHGGAIDPDGFKDVDGSRYFVYKVDGNSLNPRTHTQNPTPLMLQAVDPTDGISLIGSPIKLLDHQERDGPLIEGPSLTRVNGSGPLEGVDIYVLFFSSNVFTSKFYNVNYATSTNGIRGPYVRGEKPLLQTGDNNGQLYGPGGLDVGLDGQKVVFHSGIRRTSFIRGMWIGDIVVDNRSISI